MKQVVIYHANCIDGFTAAWCCWRRFGDAAEYVPAKHGDPLPLCADGNDVVIVDFSYPRETLLTLRQMAHSVLVLDHHKTAEADLAGLDFCKFDMNQSGAGMASWEFLGGVSPLVRYVEDRDLWRFKLPDSKEVNAFIGSLEQTFQEWSRADAMLHLPDGLSAAVIEGRALLRGVDRYCREMAQQARRMPFAGYSSIPVVNAPYINTSELVGHLAEKAMFAVGWFQRADGKYQYSLRSRGDFDVSELAKRFGGGGHRQAAGFTVDERVA